MLLIILIKEDDHNTPLEPKNNSNIELLILNPKKNDILYLNALKLDTLIVILEINIQF